MRRALAVVTITAAALLLAAGCGDDGGSGRTFSWTVYDSNRWSHCLVDALGAKPRTDAEVRQTAASCVRILRPKLADRTGVFADCASATNAEDRSATDLVYALELEHCFGR